MPGDISRHSFLVIHSMMGTWAGGIQRQETVAILNTPDQDLLHCVHTESFNIMLKNDGNTSAGTAIDYIFKNFLCSFSTACVIAVHIPVKVLESGILHRHSQPAHNTGIEFTDSIGTAAGESHQRGTHAGVVVNNVLHPVQIPPQFFKNDVRLDVAYRQNSVHTFDVFDGIPFYDIEDVALVADKCAIYEVSHCDIAVMKGVVCCA